MMTPRRIARTALARGLAGIAIADHGTIQGGLAVRAAAPTELLVVVGAEIYTTVGDIVCLFLSQEITGRDPLDVIAQAHEQGGVAFFPHPLRSHPKQIPTEVLAACDGYEELNARAGGFSPTGNPEAASHWGALVGKARLANSDAHLYSEIGAAFTSIEGPATEENIRQAILLGATYPGGVTVPARNFYKSQLIKAIKTRDISMVARFTRRLFR